MSDVYLDRIARVRAAMDEQGVDALMVSVGHDLPYLTGYLAMPLERLTMLVVPVLYNLFVPDPADPGPIRRLISFLRRRRKSPSPAKEA